MSERDFKRESECLHHNYVPRDCPVCLRIALKESRLAEAAAVERGKKAEAELAAERAAEERAAKLYTEAEAKNRALRAELTQRTLDYAGWMQGIPQERDAALARAEKLAAALNACLRDDGVGHWNCIDRAQEALDAPAPKVAEKREGEK